MSEFNINPVHLNPISEGSSFTFSNPTAFYQQSAKAYQNAHAEGSSFTFSNPQLSGYQYALISSIPATAAENCLFRESVQQKIIWNITENLFIKEIVDTNPHKDFENSLISESVQQKIIYNISENMFISDAATGKTAKSFFENSLMKESVAQNVIYSASENTLIKESVQQITRLTFTYTCYINGQVRNTQAFTNYIQGATRYTNAFTTRITGMQYGLVAATVTGVGPLGDSNPMGPLVLTINGSSIIGTAASSTPSVGTYINVPNTGTSINPIWTWKDLFQFSTNLDYSGGTFSIASTQNYGAGGGGSPITLFGLKAVITDPGKRYNNSMKAYTIDGTFGSPLLNKQFKLLQNSSELIYFLTQGTTQNNATNPIYITVQAVSEVIARICGINLIWAAQDLPVNDFAFEGTMNGFTALNSLASRVGANLRWHGNNTYYVAPPGFTIGEFRVPNQKLINGNGIEYHSHYDLETGIGGAAKVNGFGTPIQTLTNYAAMYQNQLMGQKGIVAIPINANQVALVVGGPASLVQPLVGVGQMGSTVITVDDPPQEFQLPANYQSVLIQCLIVDSSGNALTPLGQSTSQFANPITTNKDQWYDFVPPGNQTNAIQTGSLGDNPDGTSKSNPEYIYTKFEGGMYKPYMKLDYRFYDFLLAQNIQAITDGHFKVNIACYTTPLPSNIVNFNPNIIQQYVQTYKAIINCLFWGVMPLPGMLGIATVDDLTVEGVIESVSFSPPGFLQLQIAQYTGIRWSQPYLNITAS